MQKTNFKTRLLALLTAAFMLVMCVPFAAFAEDAAVVTVTFDKGDEYHGTDWTPYLTKKLCATDNVVKAPDVLPDGYYWKSNVGTKDLKAKDLLTYDDVKAAGDNVGYSPAPVEPETTPIEVSFFDGFGKPIKTETLTETTDSVEEPAATRVAYDTDEYEFHGDWANTFTNPVETNMVTSFDYNTLKFFATTDDEGVAHVYLYPVLTEKKPETKTVKFCFQLNTAEGNFTDKNIAGFTSTNVSYVVGGKDTVVNVPAVEPNKGYTFKGWTDDNGDFVMEGTSYNMFGKNFDAYEDGQTIWMTAVFEKDGESVQPETPELKTINVSFVDAKDGRSVADTISFVKGEDGKHFPMEATNVGKDQILQGWNGHAIDAFYGAGQWVTFDDLAKYVAASSINKDGYASLTFEADVATKQPSKPVAADVTKIYVHFNDEIGLYKTDIVYKDHGYITAPATDMSVSEYDYTWNNEDGLIFNVGDVIKFADVIDKAGAYYVEDDGTVSAHISFTKTAKPQPSEDVLTKNIKFQISQVEGAKWTEKEYNDEDIDTRIYTVYSDATGKYTAPAAAMDGKDFLYWVCQYGDKVIKINAGEQFNYDDMTAKGISATETGDFAFNPVFKDKASSSSSSSSSSSNKTTTASNEKQVVKAAAAPANTTKVLPKTGASNVAPLLGGSLAVVALLMGYGVYSLVLRKKD